MGNSISYLSSSGRFCDSVGTSAEYFDNLFNLLGSPASIGTQLSILSGKEIPEFHQVAAPIGTARGVVSASRFIISFERFVTGKFLWKRDAKGEFEKKDDKYLFKAWYDVAIEICLFVARLFSPILFLHKCKIFDL